MNIEALVKSAKQAQNQGDYAAAERYYLQLLNLEFQPEAILNALVDVCFQANYFARATKYLTRLNVNYPKKVAYCDALANLYARAQKWQAAADCYASFVAHNPSNADAHYNYAFNLKLAAKYQQAVESYQAALDNNIRQPEEVLTNMAVIYSEHLRLECKAMESLELAIAKAPDYIPAMFNLATLHEELGSKDKALKLYQKILKLDGRHYSALVRLAEAQQVGDSGASIVGQLKSALLDSTIDNPTRSSLSFALGKLLDGYGLYQEAFDYYSDGNRIDNTTRPKYNGSDHCQQIDDNIAFFTERWFATLESVSNARPIFICGMFRSGSTLIEQVLASHSDVTAGGERDYFLRVGTSDIHPFPDGIDELPLSKLRALADDYMQDLTKAFPDATIITDKRPDNFLYLGLIKALFPRAKIIHTQRHHLDNCLSVYFLRASSAMAYATDLDDIAHYYKQYSRLMGHWKSLFTDDIYEVDYDRLIDNPEPVVRALLHYLELPWQKECLEFHTLENLVKTASIWQVRQPLYKTSSGRWKNYQKNISSLLQAFEK